MVSKHGSPSEPRAASVQPPLEIEEHDACGVGFLADLAGRPSHEVVRLALAAAGAMMHRGARGADGRTGDGAGILCETPRKLLARELARVDLAATSNHVAAICLFLPREPDAAAAARAAIEARVRSVEITPLRWRTPATHEEVLGAQALTTRPIFEQLVVDMGPGNVRERMRGAARAIEKALVEFGRSASLLSCSATSVVYKALLSSDELGAYFDDLRDEMFASRFALFHQRFSTNSSPAWRLVQPFRHIAHNGEINTITGNRAWLEARGIRTMPGASDSYDFNTNIDAMVGAGDRGERFAAARVLRRARAHGRTVGRSGRHGFCRRRHGGRRPRSHGIASAALVPYRKQQSAVRFRSGYRGFRGRCGRGTRAPRAGRTPHRALRFG
jgi:glutamate synthase domain-containing protein 1